MAISLDALIIGAGPAGCTAAIRLTRLGYRVGIVANANSPLRAVESVSPAIFPVLENLKVCEELLAEGAVAERPSVVSWGGKVRAILAGRWVVDRWRFDRHLLQTALRAGVLVLVSQSSAPHWSDNCWRVSAEGDVLSARFLIDAAGRRGILPGKLIPLAPPLLAVIASGEAAAGIPDSVVEAGNDAWYWGMKLPARRGLVAAFFDPRCSPIRSLVDARELLVRCTQFPASDFGQATICRATPTRIAEPMGDNWLKIGDAALHFDPLAAQGVTVAIASGWLAGAVIHTLFSTPQHAPAVRDFYDRWIHENETSHQKHLQSFYGDQARFTSTPFWVERSAVIPAHDVSNFTNGSPPLLERLATASSGRWVQTPVLIGDLILLQPAFLTHMASLPVAYVSGIPVKELADALRGNPSDEDQLARLTDRYGAQGRTLFHSLRKLCLTIPGTLECFSSP